MQTLLTLLIKIVLSPARVWFSVHNVFGRAWSRFSVYTISEELWKAHAKSLREVVQASTGCIERHCPHFFDESVRCTKCGFSTFVLMQPDEICAKCWVARLDRTIDRDYSAAEASRIKASVRAHLML